MRVWRTVTKAKPEPPGCQRAQTWGPWHHHFNPVTCQVSTGFGIWGGGFQQGQPQHFLRTSLPACPTD